VIAPHAVAAHGKVFADKHCLVFDSGDEFTSIGVPMVDEADRPYLRFRYGVGDWKAGGEPAMPWRNMYTGFAGGRWQVGERIPEDWPEGVRVQAEAEGTTAFGDRSQGRWFIFYRNDRFNAEQPTSIFLQHESGKFAARTGGPAKLP
jgi:hypothetical protein